jgi:hypothetical protein
MLNVHAEGDGLTRPAAGLLDLRQAPDPSEAPGLSAGLKLHFGQTIHQQSSNLRPSVRVSRLQLLPVDVSELAPEERICWDALPH